MPVQIYIYWHVFRRGCSFYLAPSTKDCLLTRQDAPYSQYPEWWGYHDPHLMMDVEPLMTSESLSLVWLNSSWAWCRVLYWLVMVSVSVRHLNTNTIYMQKYKVYTTRTNKMDYHDFLSQMSRLGHLEEKIILTLQHKQLPHPPSFCNF